MIRPAPRFGDALATLARHGVEFVVVGGVAAVLNGAPISTFDLDIVHARSEENLDRLLAALTELDARDRDLAALIRTKEQAGRDKDRAVLAILRRTLRERGDA